MREKGGANAPPFFFLPAVLLLGVLFEGGDWPPATFLIRASLFLAAGHLVLRRDEFTVRATLPDLLVAAFWGLAALSLVRGGYRWVTYQWFLTYTAAAALYASIRALPSTDDERIAAVLERTVVAAALGLAAIALFQRGALGWSRPPATLQNPNFLAEFLVYGVGMLLARASGPVAPGSGGGRIRWAALALPLLLGIAASGSRGGGILLFATAGFFLWRWLGWRRALPIALAVPVCLILVPNPLLERFTGHGDPYAFARLQMWRSALRVFLDHPLGVGLGQFKYYWNMMPEPIEGTILRYGMEARNPHNEYLSVLSEMGVPGACALLAAVVAAAVSLRRVFHGAHPVPVRGAALILSVSGLHAAVDFNYHVPVLLLTNAAALAVVSSHLWKPVAVRTIRLRGPVRASLLTLLGVSAAYAALTVAATGLEWRGYRAFGQGRPETAERAYAAAASADPFRATYPDAASAASYRHHEASKDPESLSRAIEWEMEAVHRNPLEYRYPARLGFLYQRAAVFFPGRAGGSVLAASLREYDRAIALNPYNVTLHYEKAMLLHRIGRDAEARSQLEGILREEPRFARGWVLLGDVLASQDRPGALAAYDRGLLLYGRYFPAAREPREKDFLEVDASVVRGKAEALRAGAGK